MSVFVYGLFASKYYFGLFCMYGKLVISSVLKCRLFQNFWLSVDTCGHFKLAIKDAPHGTL